MRKRSDKRSLWLLLAAVGAALLVGFSGRFLPDAFREQAVSLVLSPLQQTFYRFLSCLACPMIFLSVATGICGIGDTARIGRIGRRMVAAFFGISALLAVFTLLGGYFLYGLSASSGTSGSSQLSAILELILAIVPRNLFSPFIDGNTLQIIFLAVILGLALLALGKRASAVCALSEELSLVIQKLMGFLSRLMPLYVFLALLKMLWSGTLGAFDRLWLLPLLFLSVLLLSFLVLWLYASLRSRIRPLRLLKEVLPPFLIALSTSSSTASFDESMNSCDRLGIAPGLSRFGLPMSMIMYKPASVIYLAVVACYFAQVYQLSCSPMWFLSAALLSVILAFAIPPVPGGGLNNYAILFLQLGIPDAALAVALTADSVFEFIITGFNVLLQPMELCALSAGCPSEEKEEKSDVLSD